MVREEQAPEDQRVAVDHPTDPGRREPKIGGRLVRKLRGGLPRHALARSIHEQQLVRGVEGKHRDVDLFHHVREQRRRLDRLRPLPLQLGRHAVEVVYQAAQFVGFHDPHAFAFLECQAPQGAGLGLAVVKLMSDLLQGTARVVADTPESFQVYSGDGPLLLPMLAVGAVGGMGVNLGLTSPVLSFLPHRIEPTVITGLPESARCLREEVFGPICHVAPFDTEDEAIALARAYQATGQYDQALKNYTAALEKQSDSPEASPK